MPLTDAVLTVDVRSLRVIEGNHAAASLLGAALRLVQDDLATLPEAVAMVSTHPARATGLHDRGALREGLRADLIQVRVVDLPDGSQHGVVRAVWREGQRVL